MASNGIGRISAASNGIGRNGAVALIVVAAAIAALIALTSSTPSASDTRQAIRQGTPSAWAVDPPLEIGPTETTTTTLPTPTTTPTTTLANAAQAFTATPTTQREVVEALPLVGTTTPTTTTTRSAPKPPVQPTTTTTTTPPPNCGGVGPEGMSGSWTCTFDDEFNGTTLNTSNWLPQVTANSSYTSGDTACFVNSPDNISVSGGDLHLSAQRTAAPFLCSDPAGSFETSETSGEVTTYKLFSQTYGAFEVNAELPTSTVDGLQETFWLYPQSLAGYGAWPASGEIDFGELYSEYPSLDIPYIHYAQAGEDPNVTNDSSCVIEQGAFNTYGVDWTPGVITVYLNGAVCLSDHYDPAFPLSSPAPFNQPFLISLTQALGMDTNAYSSQTQLPATTLINYVRAWQAVS